MIAEETKGKETLLMSGNDAVAEAAFRAGCNHYYGYPITPQNELLEYMSKRMPEAGRTFIQAESELAAIHMIFGAAAAGGRAMTSTSSPGISLMLEGLSHLAAAELPCVVVDVVRAGPGSGNIFPSQSDYALATRGGGHGDFHNVVLAPSTVQEMADYTIKAFDIANRYRNPVVILSDGVVAHLMEKVTFMPVAAAAADLSWCARGANGRARNVVSSSLGLEEACEAKNRHLKRKYDAIRSECVRVEEVLLDDSEIVIVAFGIVARIAKSAVKMARARGIKVGLLRPITLFPFPFDRVTAQAETGCQFLVAEMNLGQMVDDVRLAVQDDRRISFLGRPGGVVISPEEIFRSIETIAASK